MVKACRWQIRSAPMGGVVGLDFGAVASFATALAGGMSPLLAEILPEVEGVIVAQLRGDPPPDDGAAP